MTYQATEVTEDFAVQAGQRVFRVSDTDDQNIETFVKLSVQTEKQAQLFKWTIKPMIVDQSGAYLDVGGEPVILPAGEHTFQLGSSDGSPSSVLLSRLGEEAIRAHRFYSQVLEMVE